MNFLRSVTSPGKMLAIAAANAAEAPALICREGADGTLPRGATTVPEADFGGQGRLRGWYFFDAIGA